MICMNSRGYLFDLIQLMILLNICIRQVPQQIQISCYRYQITKVKRAEVKEEPARDHHMEDYLAIVCPKLKEWQSTSRDLCQCVSTVHYSCIPYFCPEISLLQSYRYSFLSLPEEMFIRNFILFFMPIQKGFLFLIMFCVLQVSNHLNLIEKKVTVFFQ